MISDGYGDESEFESYVRDREPLLRIQAYERIHPDNVPDAVNEARYTIWEVLQKRPDAPPEYVRAAAKTRITEVSMRGNWLGQPSQRGKPSVDPLRRADRDSFDDPDFLVEASAPEILDTLELAYHEGQILEAIRTLPRRHQEYVVLRFWGGWTHAELAPLMGVKTNNMARMWTETIKPLLAERLAHLAEV